ncbi:MAG: 6-bladed beta-propeller [Bacteroidaceae bacterium]|nr:6-bladed beta-propeller [Bacteroidaceae bacterium]
MKNLYLGIYTLCVLLFVSCKPNTQSNIFSAGRDNNIITIDLDKSNECTELLYSSYFKEPKTIILETTENCLIKRIHGIEIFNENIYIHDDKMKRLFVFDMNGKYKYEIGKPGAGPGEYVELSDFSIDREKNVIYLWDEAKKNAMKFDLNTNEFISSIHIPEIKGQSYSFLYKNDRFYINSTTEHQESDKYLLNEIDCNNGQIIQRHLPAASYNKNWNVPLRISNSNFYSKSNQSSQYIEMFSDTIVSITDDGILASYAVVSDLLTPQKVVDEINQEFYTTGGKIDLMPLYVKGYIYQICHFMDTDKYIYFQFTKGTDVQHSFFHKENGNIETSLILKNDYIVPNNYIHTNLVYNNEKGVLTILNTEQLTRFIKYLSEDKINKELDKYEQLIKLDEDSNPVLFYHEYK